MCAQVCEHSRNTYPEDFWGSDPSLWKRSHLAWETEKMSWKIMKNLGPVALSLKYLKSEDISVGKDHKKSARLWGALETLGSVGRTSKSVWAKGAKSQSEENSLDWSPLISIVQFVAVTCWLFLSQGMLRCSFSLHSIRHHKAHLFHEPCRWKFMKILCISESENNFIRFIRQRLYHVVPLCQATIVVCNDNDTLSELYVLWGSMGSGVLDLEQTCLLCGCCPSPGTSRGRMQYQQYQIKKSHCQHLPASASIDHGWECVESANILSVRCNMWYRRRSLFLLVEYTGSMICTHVSIMFDVYTLERTALLQIALYMFRRSSQMHGRIWK